MRNEINLSDEQIEERFEDLGYCADIDEIIFTRDSMEDFGAKDMDTLEREGCQDRKGEPRYTLVVVDFGAVRAVLKA